MFDRLLFAAPRCTYKTGPFADDLDGFLCWLPWKEDIPAPPQLGPKKANSTSVCDAVPLPGSEGQAGQTAGFQTSCGIVSPSCNYCKDNCCSTACPQVDDDAIPVYSGHVADSLPCLWFQAQNSSTVFLVCHANAEDLGLYYDTARTLHEQFQVSVLAIEYPGYGLLQNIRASEENCYRAALVAMRYLVVELGVSYSQVMLLGRSMGSGPALFLASKFPVAGVILINAFMSVSDVAAKYVGRLSSLAYGGVFMNKRMIKHVSSPVLFIHALADKVVPVSHSTRLFEMCPSKKLLVMPDCMDHNSNLFENAEFFTLPALRFFRFLGRRGNRRPPRPMPPELFGRDKPLLAVAEESTGSLSKTFDSRSLGLGTWFASRLPSCVVMKSPYVTTALHQDPAKMAPVRSGSPSVKRLTCVVQPEMRPRQRRACWSCCTRRDDSLGGDYAVTEPWHEAGPTNEELQASGLPQPLGEDCPEPPMSCDSDSMCPERSSDLLRQHPAGDTARLGEPVHYPEQDDDWFASGSEDCFATPLSAGDPFCGRWARPGTTTASTSWTKERQPVVVPLQLLSPRTGLPINH